AVYAACTLRSFRTRRLADLLAFGASSAYLAAEVDRAGSVRTYELTLEPASRKVRLDGKAVRPLSRYFGGFQVVLFAPEDLAVARASPGERRACLDRAVFQRTPEYLGEAQSYDKVLRTRNAVLRTLRERGTTSASAGGLLEVYDQQLAELAARRMARRAGLVAERRPRFQRAVEAIGRADRPAGLAYAPQGPGASEALGDEAALAGRMMQALASARPADLARAVTTVGPHRDDLELLLGDRPAAAFASQGQLRAMVLAWKIAEMEILAEAHGHVPILLLDDVSSELDPRRN